MSRQLCESAKNGRLCCDDLCHSGGETLCGFDPDFYEEVKREFSDEPPYDDGPEDYDDAAKAIRAKFGVSE